jgi:hypothetical protein
MKPVENLNRFKVAKFGTLPVPTERKPLGDVLENPEVCINRKAGAGTNRTGLNFKWRTAHVHPRR